MRNHRFDLQEIESVDGGLYLESGVRPWRFDDRRDIEQEPDYAETLTALAATPERCSTRSYRRIADSVVAVERLGTISRTEVGTTPVRLSELRELMDLYGVDDPVLRAGLEQLTRDIWGKGWWDSYFRDVQVPIIDLAWLESRAERIRDFSPLVLHGLLQTPDYAEAVIRTAGRGPTSRSSSGWSSG